MGWLPGVVINNHCHGSISFVQNILKKRHKFSFYSGGLAGPTDLPGD